MIKIHINTDNIIREQLWNSIQWTDQTPLAQHVFCEILSQITCKPIVAANDYNQYGHDNQWNYANFSYTGDNFLLKYSFYKREIFLYGEPYSLIRVFRDLLAIKSPILPLHASCYYKGGKCFAVAGDSGSGKSYYVAKEMEKGALYISDDMLFVDKHGRVYCSDNLVWKYNPNGSKRALYVESKNIYWGHRALDGIKILSCEKEGSLKDLRQPFPVKQLQSYWCLPFFVNESDMYGYVEKQVNASVVFWQKQIYAKKYV